MKQSLVVNGMHCNSCTVLITETLTDNGAKNVSVVLNQAKQVGTVTLESSLSKKELQKLIESEGDYTVQ